MIKKLYRNVPYHESNSWKKFRFFDVIIQVMTSSHSFRLPLTTHKIPFTKTAINPLKIKVFQFFFDFPKAERIIYHIIASFYNMIKFDS